MNGVRVYIDLNWSVDSTYIRREHKYARKEPRILRIPVIQGE
jgi:hypothetical protein